MDVAMARKFLHSAKGAAEYQKLGGDKLGEAAVIAAFLNKDIHRVEAVLVEINPEAFAFLYAKPKKPSLLSATYAACRKLCRLAEKAVAYAERRERYVKGSY
jgi:hypothetical protein